MELVSQDVLCCYSCRMFCHNILVFLFLFSCDLEWFKLVSSLDIFFANFGQLFYLPIFYIVVKIYSLLNIINVINCMSAFLPSDIIRMSPQVFLKSTCT